MTSQARTSDQKAWARERFRGAESLLMPSFTPDFSALDEAAVRVDVRNSIDHGFFSTAGSRLAIPGADPARLLEVAIEEAQGRILVSSMVAGQSTDNDIAWAEHCKRIGVSHLFLMPPRPLPTTGAELLAHYRAVAEATDLPVIVYASLSSRTDLGPSGTTLDVFDALADLANVVAIKLTQPMPASTAFQVAECLSDRLLLGPVHLDLFPLLARHYGAQWTGQWLVESMQSPQHPYVVDFVNACAAGDFDAAMSTFDAFEPALRAFFDFQAPLIKNGGHPLAHMKYYKWCTGGNGGLPLDAGHPRDQVPVLSADDRSAIRATYARIGVDVVDDGSFHAGRAATARGATTMDVAQNGLYEGEDTLGLATEIAS
jgi:4-hydroxy-tetrahydrodipicolinate synthase